MHARQPEVHEPEKDGAAEQHTLGGAPAVQLAVEHGATDATQAKAERKLSAPGLDGGAPGGGSATPQPANDVEACPSRRHDLA